MKEVFKKEERGARVGSRQIQWFHSSSYPQPSLGDFICTIAGKNQR